jgi:hypothetical protein
LVFGWFQALTKTPPAGFPKASPALSTTNFTKSFRMGVMRENRYKLMLFDRPRQKPGAVVVVSKWFGYFDELEDAIADYQRDVKQTKPDLMIHFHDMYVIKFNTEKIHIQFN